MMIRSYRESDNDAVIALSLRAWAPVFVSLEQVMDPDVYDSFYPDGWREHQRDAVRAALGNQDAWVAEEDGVVIGFASVVLHADDGLGEIHMIAVDPDHQKRGIGSALTRHALAWMREAGMSVAMVETGGDPGHDAARRTYERTGFGLLPIARYFRKL